MDKGKNLIFGLLANDGTTEYFNEIEFYLFDQPSGEAIPFAKLDYCPDEISMSLVGDRMYLIGGSILSEHVEEKFYYILEKDWEKEVERYLDDGTRKYLTEHGVRSLVRGTSDRVMCIEYAKYVRRSLSKRGGDLQTDWQVFPSLSLARRRSQVLNLGGKMYVVGGNTDISSCSIEVFEKGKWTPLISHNAPNIDPCLFVVVAIDEPDTILVGSNGSFYVAKVIGIEGLELEWRKLDGVHCPPDVFERCCEHPGLKVANCALFYHASEACIRGLCFLGDNNYKHFNVDVRDLVVPEEDNNCSGSKLIHMGNWRFGLIYVGMELKTDHDDQTVEVEEMEECDYHFVTFDITYDSSIVDSNIPFPGIPFKKREVSHTKFYARDGDLAAAFVVSDDLVPCKRKSDQMDQMKAGGSQST